MTILVPSSRCGYDWPESGGPAVWRTPKGWVALPERGWCLNGTYESPQRAARSMGARIPEVDDERAEMLRLCRRARVAVRKAQEAAWPTGTGCYGLRAGLALADLEKLLEGGEGP